MSVDLTEFHEIYFAECLENLEALQVGVSQLRPADPDCKAMTRVYRAAHSIKGASAIFGFQKVSDTAHALQIMLEQIRQNKRELEPELIVLLQQSIERLHKKLEAVRIEQALDVGRIEEQRQILRQEEAEQLGVRPMLAKTTRLDSTG